MTKPQKVLITGGSSGIGFELSKLFAADGHHLLIAAKPQKELDLASTKLQEQYPNLAISTYQVDLAEPQGSLRLYNAVKKDNHKPDIVINNAGIGTYGTLLDTDETRELNMLSLNIVNLYKLTRLYLKDMTEQDKGQIMNIASIAAFQPTPMMATYAATKAFVHSFSRAISFELEEAGSNVRVTTICPPATRTPFQQSAGMQDTNTFDSIFTLNPDRVASDAYKALWKKQDLVLPGTGMKTLSALVNLMPTGLRMKLARQLLLKKNG